MNQSTSSLSGNAHSPISQPNVSRRFSSGKNLKMAESEEAEDSVDYYAVLNVRKEVKIVFQREKKGNI